MFVALDVELDKEDEERDVSADRELEREVRELLMLSADSAGGHTNDKVFIDHCSNADNELSDLNLSDITLPPAGLAQSGDGVIIVHESVDNHVCPGTDGAIGAVVDEEEPGEREGDEVVINMEETKTRLASKKENCVNKLPSLGEEEEEENPGIETFKEDVGRITKELVDVVIGSVEDDNKEHCQAADSTEKTHHNVVENKEMAETVLVFRPLVTSNDDTGKENKVKITEGKKHNEIKRRNGSRRNVVDPLANIVRKITAVVCVALFQRSPIAETRELGTSFLQKVVYLFCKRTEGRK